MTKYDLKERTEKFGKDTIEFRKNMPVNHITLNIIDQLLRSATSIGANYCEADNAHSKKDFRHKISICRKESREARHWLIMMASASPPSKKSSEELAREAHELNLIFNKIFISTGKQK
ncbi:MAG: four helix bundle protein [Candidatus Gracilibacteria bacterium]|nr:four helix bundle protein [Candidatus Gracilibacteria bacterium]